MLVSKVTVANLRDGEFPCPMCLHLTVGQWKHRLRLDDDGGRLQVAVGPGWELSQPVLDLAARRAGELVGLGPFGPSFERGVYGTGVIISVCGVCGAVA